jgi:hypothetical protein
MADVRIEVPVGPGPAASPLVESFFTLLHHLLCAALRLETGAKR